MQAKLAAAEQAGQNAVNALMADLSAAQAELARALSHNTSSAATSCSQSDCTTQTADMPVDSFTQTEQGLQQVSPAAFSSPRLQSLSNSSSTQDDQGKGGESTASRRLHVADKAPSKGRRKLRTGSAARQGRVRFFSLQPTAMPAAVSKRRNKQPVSAASPSRYAEDIAAAPAPSARLTPHSPPADAILHVHLPASQLAPRESAGNCASTSYSDAIASSLMSSHASTPHGRRRQINSLLAGVQTALHPLSQPASPGMQTHMPDVPAHAHDRHSHEGMECQQHVPGHGRTPNMQRTSYQHHHATSPAFSRQTQNDSLKNKAQSYSQPVPNSRPSSAAWQQHMQQQPPPDINWELAAVDAQAAMQHQHHFHAANHQTQGQMGKHDTKLLSLQLCPAGLGCAARLCACTNPAFIALVRKCHVIACVRHG